MTLALTDLAPLYRAGTPRGIVSVCSAHPLVLRTALRHGRETGVTVLIEATCNQVNHQGGYTGMTPSAFATLVHEIAAEESCPAEQIILGGDHLGPNPWRDLPAEAAMAEAERMVAAYVGAGFRKIHIDASMACADDPVAPDDETIATRAALLARVAEDAVKEGPMPLYILGTEVPPPGGADHALTMIEPTLASDARRTIAIHEGIFARAGLADAFSRVIGFVVQPGVEFGNRNVIFYDPAKARDLAALLTDRPTLVFEAHSTDYQGQGPLSDLVADGFAILKVGPELSFVLRQALYALDLIASDLVPGYGDRPLYQTMERLMLATPENWARHYGDTGDARFLRHYSLSDRIRYYWNQPDAQKAVARLTEALRGRRVPMPLFWQHMPEAAHLADLPLDPERLLISRVSESLKAYHAAAFPPARPSKE